MSTETAEDEIRKERYAMFGRVLRSFRKNSLEKTQSDVAGALGLTKSHISNIERGDRAPLGDAQIDALATLFPFSDFAAFHANELDGLKRMAAYARGQLEVPTSTPKPQVEAAFRVLHSDHLRDLTRLSMVNTATSGEFWGRRIRVIVERSAEPDTADAREWMYIDLLASEGYEISLDLHEGRPCFDTKEVAEALDLRPEDFLDEGPGGFAPRSNKQKMTSQGLSKCCKIAQTEGGERLREKVIALESKTEFKNTWSSWNWSKIEH